MLSRIICKGTAPLAAFLLLIFISSPSAASGDKIRVVTSLTDLASIAGEIGGEYVDAFAIARGYQDPHFVDAKPSFMIKLQKADMFVEVGLDLEIGWVPLLLDGSRNAGILPGGRGFVDASRGVPLLEVPIGDPATLRAQGDIHASGNPHYWLDPARGKIIARNIFEGLVRLLPEKKAEFQKNLNAFNTKLDAKLEEWGRKMAPFAGTRIVAYHNSWPYFAERFGLDIVTFVEPKPGIPPSPKYLVQVIKSMKQNDVRIIIIAPYYSKSSSELVASRTDAEVVELATSVEAEPEIHDYFELFDYNLNKLLEAFNRKGIHPAVAGE